MRTLEVDLNKLTDEGILRFMKLKQEMKEIAEKEIQQRKTIEKQNAQWMKQPETPEKYSPPPPLPKMDVDDEQPMMFDDEEGYDDEE